MNSLVVFLSLVALAVAKPSGLLDSGIVAYSSPIIAAAPAAVSHQSRLDIKSTPAITKTVVSAPVVYSAPAAIATKTVFAAPAIATAAIAPAAISHQSRLDIKSTPAITSTVVSAPIAYSAPAISYGAPAISYSAPAIAYNGLPALAYKEAYAYSAAPFLKTYAAPAILKTAAIAPAVVAASTLPLETPEVIAARAAHFEAKEHLIRKRSASLVATPVLSTYSSPLISSYSTPLLSTYHAPLAYSAPIALSAPLLTKAYSVHPW